jgi:hypothetical protein
MFGLEKGHADVVVYRNVKKSVGEVDFGFHILSTAQKSRNQSESTLLTQSTTGSGEGKGKQD